jgi:hypothetical protein
MTQESLWHKIVHFFDKLEDKVRARLSRTPIFYGLIAGIGIILFWRGIWHLADQFESMTGLVSLILGTVILLLSGAFVSSLVGNRLILSGLLGEKKLAEKTREELENEDTELKRIERNLNRVEQKLEQIEKDISHHDSEHKNS